MERQLPQWMWDEYRHVGTDYDNIEQVRDYDERMARFRDFEAEHRRVFDAVGLGADDTLLEIGCGTGNLAIAAASRCRRVIAYDISRPMLQYARQKAEDAGLANIEFREGGFLTAHETFSEEQADVAVSQFVLHHLPDLWKAIALRMIAGMLRQGGRFFLNDVVFSFDLDEHAQHLAAWPESLPPDTAGKAYKHLACEYSTQDWAMQEMLRRAGLSIDRVVHDGPMFMRYTCTRIEDDVPWKWPEIVIDEELTLRPVRLSDADAMFTAVDGDRERLRKWMPWIDGTQSPDDTEAFVRRSYYGVNRVDCAPFVIVYRGGLVGVVGYHEINRASKTLEIGYWLTEAAEGNGVMTRCLQALLDRAFDEMGMNRVEIDCWTENVRSRAVPERLGFRHEGTLRQIEILNGQAIDMEIYSMLRDEWRSLEKFSSD